MDRLTSNDNFESGTHFAQLLYPNWDRSKVEAEEQQEIFEAYSVSLVPYFVFFKDGKMVDTLKGAYPSELANKVSKIMGSIHSGESVPVEISFTKQQVDFLVTDHWRRGKDKIKERQKFDADLTKKLIDCIRWLKNGLQDLEDKLPMLKEADALLNEKFEGKKSDYLGKYRWTQSHIKSLQKIAKELAAEKEKLHQDEESALNVDEESRDDEEAAKNEVNRLKEELRQVKVALKDSQDDAKKENDRLRAELEKAVKDREILMQDLKDTTQQYSKIFVELDDMINATAALEDTFAYQREPLAAATKKLKMVEASSSKMRTKFAEQKGIVSGLQDRLKRKWRI